MKSARFALAICLAVAAPALAQDDEPSLARLELDRGFGRGGTVRGIRAGDKSLAHPQFIQVDSLGRIVVAGTTLTARPRGTTEGRYATLVARFLPDGRLDPEFGGDGLVTLPFDRERIGGLAVDRFGRITITDSNRVPAEEAPDAVKYVAARLVADGSLDTSFAGDGLLETDETPPELRDGVFQVRAHPSDGSLIADVYVRRPPDGEHRTFVRLKSDGSLDTAFGVGGFADLQLSYGDFAVDAQGGVVVVDEISGRLAVVPELDVGRYRVTRLRPDGLVDTGFGTLGALRGTGTSVVRGEQVEIDRTGRILVVGREDGIGRGIYRFSADGQPDLTFGRNGRAPLPFGVPGNVFTTRGPELAIARDADQYAVSAATWLYRPHTSVGYRDGYFVQAFDPEAPQAVAAYVRTWPRIRSRYPQMQFDGAAVSPDGTAAFVIQHTETSRFDRAAALVRVDLTRAAPRPLPNLTAEWAGAPVVAADPWQSVSGTLLVRNSGRAPVAGARIDVYVSDDEHLDSGDTFLFWSTTGVVRAGAERARPLAERLYDFRGVILGRRLIAHVNPLGELPELDSEDNIAVSESAEFAEQLVAH